MDPSNKFRPEKREELFRNFTDNCVYHSRVQKLYSEMHTKQTYDFAKGKVGARFVKLYTGRSVNKKINVY